MRTGPAFGEVLADIMRRHYIAAVDIARELGVSPALVGRWTRDEALPSPHDVMLLVERLGPRDAERLQRAAAAQAPGSSAAAQAPGSSAAAQAPGSSAAARAPGSSAAAEAPGPDAGRRRLCEAEREALLGLPAEFRLAFAEAMRRPGPA
jgi:transcriptional regulator with XRE-family HTH domain